MRSDKDQVVGSSIESSEEDTVLKSRDNEKDTVLKSRDVKENNGNISEDHSSEFEIGSKNEERMENCNGLEDSPVFYMDKNVTACDLPKTVVSDYKEHTNNIVKDICVDESKSSEDSKVEESVGIRVTKKLNQENLIVSGEEVVLKDDSEMHDQVDFEKSSSRDVVAAASGSVSKEVLTLREIISMEDFQKRSKNKNRETGQEKTEEPIVDSLRYLSFERTESTKPLLIDELEDSYDHHQNGSGGRSFSEEDSGLAHISYSGAITVSGNLSVRSDGSTVSAHSFAFPILQSEWNSSHERMAKPEKRQPRKEKGWRHYSLLLCCRF